MLKPSFIVGNDDYTIHFIGIGGIGMSGIAEVLALSGYKVTGSDQSNSANVKKLMQLGVQIFIGHKKENIPSSGVVVYSSAITSVNPEIIAAKEKGLSIIRRAEMLSEIMRLKYGLAVAGTHGKTTTTSFLATVLEESGLKPSYLIGGIVKNLEGHAKLGSGPFVVVEADESDGSFLLLSPVMSVITNIDNDHIDYYHSFDALKNAFVEFANKIPFYGVVALNIHDANLESIIPFIKRPMITFGIEKGTINARNIEYKENSTDFDIYMNNDFKVRVTINLPGRHNVLNALGASCIASHLNIVWSDIGMALSKLNGVGRRFQTLFKTEKFELIDDYGHHPTEVQSTINVLNSTRKNKNKIIVFEPHRYTRTRDCWSQFLHAFNEADKVYLLPIYAASEQPIEGISSQRLLDDINKLHPGMVEILSSGEAYKELLEKLSSENKHNVVLALGAGTIGRFSREWAKVE